MKPERTKPFSLEHAKAGAPYAQRNGLAARIGIWDSTNKNGYVLVGTLINRNGDENSCAWQANGDCTNNTRDSELVMTPLGYCEGKPVFVGDELVFDSRKYCVSLKYWFDLRECQRHFIDSIWPKTAPVMPTWFMYQNQNELITCLAHSKRQELRDYLDALDEYEGVKK